MTPIIVRQRACFRLICRYSIIQGTNNWALPRRNVPSSFQSNPRLFSAAGASSDTKSLRILTINDFSACSHYPRLPRSCRSRPEEDTTKRGKHILTQAQEDLEKAAKTVTEIDSPTIKELGHNASFETYVKLVLSRLRPFLFYFVLLGREQFLKGYGPPTSSLARGRNATVFLFISAHAWLFHAVAARSSHSPDIPPEIIQVAEKFTTAGNAVEAYVENKLPNGMGWPEVGGAIVDSSSDAWFVLSKAVGREVGTTTPSNNHEPSKESSDKGVDNT